MTRPALKPSADCTHCHAPIINIDGRWEHCIPDDTVPGIDYYTALTCDPLLFDDRQRRVATPKGGPS